MSQHRYEIDKPEGFVRWAYRIVSESPEFCVMSECPCLKSQGWKSWSHDLSETERHAAFAAMIFDAGIEEAIK